jgi:hypothetical protein
MTLRYTTFLSSVTLIIAGFGLYPVTTSAQPADPIGTCCLYDQSGLLSGCPVTIESQCVLDNGFAEAIWECPNPGLPDCGRSTCDITQGGISIGDCQPSVVLPVELTSFEALTQGRSEVLLTWSTASETNNSGFDVEIRRDAELFDRLGFVEGRGTTTNAQTYSYRVTDLDPGSYFFRLKQIDFDGAFDYSPVVEATVEVPGNFVLEDAYPNPFNPSTTVRFAVATEKQVRLNLYDAGGKLVRTLYDGLAPANSMQSVTIDGSGLASGTYHVRLEGATVLATTTVTLLK